MSRRPAWLVRARPEASSLVIKVVELTNELGLVTRRTRGWGNPEIPSKIPLSPQSKAEGPHIPYFHRKSTVPPTYHTCLISGPVAARHSLRSATCVRDHLALASRPTYAPPPPPAPWTSAHAGAPRRHARAVSVGAGGGRSRAAVPSAAAGVAEALAGRAERGAGGGGGAKGGTGGAVQRGGPRRGLGACLARRGGRGLQQAARVPLYVGQHRTRAAGGEGEAGELRLDVDACGCACHVDACAGHVDACACCMHMRLQPGGATVAAWVSYGCRAARASCASCRWVEASARRVAASVAFRLG